MCRTARHRAARPRTPPGTRAAPAANGHRRPDGRCSGRGRAPARRLSDGSGRGCVRCAARRAWVVAAFEVSGLSSAEASSTTISSRSDSVWSSTLDTAVSRWRPPSWTPISTETSGRALMPPPARVRRVRWSLPRGRPSAPARAAPPRRARRGPTAPAARDRGARARSHPGSPRARPQSTPVSPSRTRSRIPGTSVPITGRPHAIASIAAFGWPS